MYKVILFLLCINTFSFNVFAQQKGNLEKDLSEKMSILKDTIKSRKIEKKNRLFFDFKMDRDIVPSKMTKDSLRHSLVDINGFCDYNFEYFQLKLNSIDKLNKSFLAKSSPKLNKLLSDPAYNKITYDYKKDDSGIVVDAIISKNYIELDSIWGISGEMGVGYNKQYMTIGGVSNVMNPMYKEDKDYNNIFTQLQHQSHPVILDNNNRFKIKADVSSHVKKYVTLLDRAGNIILIVKVD